LEPALDHRAAALRENASPALDSAIKAEASKRVNQYLKGLRAYRSFPQTRKVKEAPVIWQSGTTRVRDYAPNAKKNAPVILAVPSLINRYYIFDLDENHSFLREMAAQGFRPLVVDWDVPGDEEKPFGIGDYVLQRLAPAAEFIQKKFGMKPHVVGYCIGGVLTLALASLRPQLLRSLTLLATPWDFHGSSTQTGPLFAMLSKLVMPGVEKLGEVPVEFMQAFFSALQPMQVARKFSYFAELDQTSTKAKDFVTLEDWLNDAVPLSAGAARDCLDLYSNNPTAKKRWKLAGQIIDPSQLTMPSYICVPGKDYIVPPEAARPLADMIHYTTLHQPSVGHIGMMASRSAAYEVWMPLRQWLARH
jgi:polyhydroxyalkanoate synthase